jgi:hypothetical protein
MLAHGTGIAIGTDGHTLARREHRKKPFHVRHGRQRWKDAREHGSGVGKAATKSLSDGAVARAGAACPTAAAAWKKAAISSKVVSGAMRAPVASSSAWMRSMMSLAGWVAAGSSAAERRNTEFRIQNPESKWGLCGRDLYTTG